MGLSRSESRSTDRPRRRGWSVRRYVVLFMVVLVAVAALAGVAVRTLGQQDARQVATADARFAASAAATEIAGDLLLLQQVTAKLAANPQVPAIIGSPNGPCTLTFAGASPFSAGHLTALSRVGLGRGRREPSPGARCTARQAGFRRASTARLPRRPSSTRPPVRYRRSSRHRSPVERAWWPRSSSSRLS